MFKKISLFVLLFCVSFNPATASSVKAPVAVQLEASKFEPLFQAKKWADIDALVLKSGTPLAPRERSLVANAYRLQNRNEDVVKILADLSGFPADIAPYAKMLLVISLENLNRKDEALKLANELRKNPPAGLGYFASYASYRLSGNAGEKLTALREMSSHANEKTQRAYTLEELIKAGENKTENAKKLLELDPSNSLGVRVLSALPKPWTVENAFLIGYAAHLAKDNKRAAEVLSTVQNNRKAQYYRGLALYQDKNYAAALNILTPLALSGNAYSLTATTRISILSNRDDAEKAVRDQAKGVLKKVADTRKGAVQARALYSLNLYDRILMEYPSSSFALKVVWSRGMDAWNAGNFKEALWYWGRANMPDISTTWGAKILYWTAKAHEKLGQKDAAAKALNSLSARYPLSIYTYIARPGAVKVVDTLPASLASAPHPLERWGFMSYAKMLLSRDSKDAKKAFRAAQIAQWLGEDAYISGLALQRFFVNGLSASRQGLQLIYPRPYLSIVRAAAAKFGVEENFVWSVMKQESAFNPLAKSHAGATGLMQLMPATAKGEAGLIKMQDYKIWEVSDNIELGTSYLSRQLRAFGNPERAAAAYNAGPGNAKRWNAGAEKAALDQWIERITFDETSDYVQRVMSNLMSYRLLYGAGKSAVLASDAVEPDDEDIEAARALEFAGTVDDGISTPKEP